MKLSLSLIIPAFALLATIAPVAAPASAADKDVISALQNLGYKTPEAERGVALARERLGEAESFERLFREALQALRKATH